VERATARLAGRPESQFPEIAAWRRAFSQMGLRPTQYRCASEALLRRFRKDGSLPSIHPLVDVCNAVSLAYAIPIAVFDLDQVTGNLTVRHATGTETYATFAGDTETPEAGEVIFADDAGHAHARRWTNRQSGRSAIRPEPSRSAVGHHQQGRDHLTATGWGDAYELQLLPPPGLDVERIFVAELDLAEPPSIRRA
jgi:DNA/RNA-binding domain of Phe-tRNA-synthetase-like protein